MVETVALCQSLIKGRANPALESRRSRAARDAGITIELWTGN
jgi:hypothetical protein